MRAPDRLTGFILDSWIVALDQRLRLERLPEIHQLVWEGKPRIKGLPVFAADRERVTAEALTAPLELEAGKIHTGQPEAQDVMLLDDS